MARDPGSHRITQCWVSWIFSFIYPILRAEETSQPETPLGEGGKKASVKSLLCLAKSTVRRNLVRQKHLYNTNPPESKKTTEKTIAPNPMNGGAWWAAVHVVAKNQT